MLVISFEEPGRLAAYGRRHALPFPLLSDGERRVYAAYGMGRAPWWRVYGLRVWNEYLRLYRRGRRLRRIRGDTLQAGGNVVIDAAGSVRLAHVGRDPTDRPAVDALLQALGCLEQD